MASDFFSILSLPEIQPTPHLKKIRGILNLRVASVITCCNVITYFYNDVITSNVITMKFKLRKIGNSYGVIIPKGFVENFSDGESIELHFDMPKEQQEMVRGALPIEPPENFNPKNSETVEEVISHDEKIKTLKKILASPKQTYEETNKEAVKEETEAIQELVLVEEDIPEEYKNA